MDLKSPKTFLMITAAMLLVALAAGIGVWVALIKYQKDLDIERSGVVEDVKNDGEVLPQPEPQSTRSPIPVIETDTSGTEVETTPETSVGIPEEPIVIERESLSETQQKLFDVLGFEGESVVISPEVVLCAREAVGETRFTEIINGSAPGPIEAAKLLSCTKN